MGTCESLASCEFFRHFEETTNRMCQGLISCYCQGPLWDRCARKGYEVEAGAQPDARMMPSGEMVD